MASRSSALGAGAEGEASRGRSAWSRNGGTIACAPLTLANVVRALATPPMQSPSLA
jgi:hypothetical protein